MYKTKQAIKALLPPQLLSLYHLFLAYIAAIRYNFPSKKIKVIAVTGTKGKSTVSEYVNAIFEKAGYKTALSSTIRFKIGEKSMPNKYKMTMPGRFFMQHFLSQAVKDNCDWAIIEMTSEGAKQHRHKFISLDALIFTNLSPEHIESHGSFEKYLKAKLKIAKSLANSKKRPRYVVANIDSEHGKLFLDTEAEFQIPVSLKSVSSSIEKTGTGMRFVFEGEEINLNQHGDFSVLNALLAGSLAIALGIDTKTVKIALEELRLVPGRMEFINEGQPFDVVVDYAHTPDSLEKLYSEAFANKKKICVLGNTGGGRDTWKRPVMAEIASKYCEKIILTDEDPYDEDPMAILKEMYQSSDKNKTQIILSRRQAINKAIKLAMANFGNTVLVTGKGTDPYIMRAGGNKEPWSDAEVTHQELRKLLGLDAVANDKNNTQTS